MKSRVAVAGPSLICTLVILAFVRPCPSRRTDYQPAGTGWISARVGGRIRHSRSQAV